MQPQRQTAHKLWISDLYSSELKKDIGEFEPNYILIKNKKVSRINLIANVVMKYQNEDRTYTNITLDDGSGLIRLKAWKEDTNLLNDLEVGDIILVIARPRQYNSEVYLAPEIVKKIDNPQWVTVRKLELEKESGKPTIIEKELPQEKPLFVEEEIIEEPTESNRQKILNLIERYSTEDGADSIEVIKHSNLEEEQANKLIFELIKEGEIFQYKPGKLRII